MSRITGKEKKKILCRGRFLSFVKEGRWEYMQRSNCTGVVIILALTGEGKVIFTEQYRPPVKMNVIEFPAGLVNDKDAKGFETHVTAARRELFEETGYKAKKYVKILQGPISSGSSSDQMVMLRAFGLKKIGKGGGHDIEDITVHEIPLVQAERWLKTKQRQGLLVDPKVYAGLYFLSKD